MAPVRVCACGEGAVGACPRCVLPLCDEHLPDDDRRCAECEATFRRRRPARVAGYLVALVATSVALVMVLFFLILATGGGALGVAPLILFGSFPIILHRLESRARLRFLGERRRPMLPRAQLVR